MTFKQKIGGVILAVLAFFGLTTAVSDNNLGSVEYASEYQATTTYSKLGTPLFGTRQRIVADSGGTLGSVVITGAVAGSMIFMDATSTTDVSSTTLTVFPASTAAGTYTFDRVFFRGLIVESTSGLTPTTTITFRSNN